jgi:plasmid stabilization system protein ParE
MTLEVRLRPEAEQDLVEAAVWYEEQRPGLGQRFLDAAGAALSTASTSPRAFPVVHGSTRRTLMRRFPFAIFYQMEEERIVVIGVFHASRHPRAWRRRL